MAIAFLYALGTAAGGISGPLVFADLTKSGVVGDTVPAFDIGAALMSAAGLVAAPLAVNAERRSPEDIATPLVLGGTGRIGSGIRRRAGRRVLIFRIFPIFLRDPL